MPQVLGIIGALDPHTHKTNQADLQGEGKLEREGVRPQRQHNSSGGAPAGSVGEALAPESVLWLVSASREQDLTVPGGRCDTLCNC